MRICLIVLIAMLMIVPAGAQGKQRPDTSPKEATAASEKEKQRKTNEDAAKAAMERIPDSKEKYDPWKSAR